MIYSMCCIKIKKKKEVARDEFLGHIDSPYVNVTNYESVKVTEDNVERLYNGLDCSGTQTSVFQGAQRVDDNHDPLGTENLLALVRSLPKELFISEILKSSSSDRDHLENARTELFSCIQNSDGCPDDSRASLKRRIKTRNGDSIEYKLAHDVYFLSTVLDGGDWEDIREMVSVPRSLKKSSSQADCDVSFQAYDITNMENIKRTVSGMMADIVLLKQENTLLKTEFQTEIKSVRAAIRSVNSDVETELNELRTLISTNALSVDRICDEKSNGVANIRGEIKQIKADVKTIMEEPVLTLDVRQVKDSVVKLSFIERRINRLEKRVQSDKTAACIDLTQPDTVDGSGHVGSAPYSTIHVDKQRNIALLKSNESNLFSRMPVMPHDVMSSEQAQLEVPNSVVSNQAKTANGGTSYNMQPPVHITDTSGHSGLRESSHKKSSFQEDQSNDRTSASMLGTEHEQVGPSMLMLALFKE